MPFLHADFKTRVRSTAFNLECINSPFTAAQGPVEISTWIQFRRVTAIGWCSLLIVSNLFRYQENHVRSTYVTSCFLDGGLWTFSSASARSHLCGWQTLHRDDTYLFKKRIYWRRHIGRTSYVYWNCSKSLTQRDSLRLKQHNMTVCQTKRVHATRITDYMVYSVH